MTPLEARKNWSNALRSNRFKQGFGALEYIDDKGNVSNCCLGVLCRLYIEDGGELSVEKSKHTTLFDLNAAMLPEKVANYIGIHSAMGRLKGNAGYLTVLNDSGVGFETIADIIDNDKLDTEDQDKCNEQKTPESNS